MKNALNSPDLMAPLAGTLIVMVHHLARRNFKSSPLSLCSMNLNLPLGAGLGAATDGTTSRRRWTNSRKDLTNSIVRYVSLVLIENVRRLIEVSDRWAISPRPLLILCLRPWWVSNPSVSLIPTSFDPILTSCHL